MLLVAALAQFVVLATTVAANPIAIPNSPISLPITKQISLNGTFHPGQRYQKRWMNRAMGRQRSTSGVIDVPLTDSEVNYLANIGIGDPPTYCESCQFLPAIVS
jgi:cathepsin E